MDTPQWLRRIFASERRRDSLAVATAEATLEATVAAHGVVMASGNADPRDQTCRSSRHDIGTPVDRTGAFQLVPPPPDRRPNSQMPITLVAEDEPRLSAGAAVILARLVRDRLGKTSERSPARRFGLVTGEGEAHCDP